MGRSGRGDVGARGARAAARDRRGDGARRGRALPGGGPVHRPARRGRPRPRGDQSRSRFEADLNRPRREAIYRKPDDCWGLDVWRDGELVRRALRGQPGDVRRLLRRARARGSTPWPSAARSCCSTCTPTTTGATAPTSRRPRPRRTPRSTSAPGSLDTDLFGPLVERFMGDLRDASLGCGPLDARENVVFEGRGLAWWVHDRYPRVGLRAGAGVQEDLHGRVDR